MGITVLGPLTVDGSGRLGPRDRVVLQALATRLGQPVSADELIDAVWRDHPPASAAKNLQSCVVRLRKALGAAGIETSPHGYALVVPSDCIDAHEFETQVTRARGLLTVGASDRVAFLLEQALSLWRGPAFPDLPDWPPARREAGRLDELRLEAQEMHADALLRSGRPREVLALAHAMVRAAPLRERRWELLALAQYQAGAQGEALRSLRQLRAVLAHELGIDPAPEMLALEQSILRQDPGLLVPEPGVRASQCPWQGLRAYDVDDTERFFGRDRDVQSCLALLGTSRLVALVGPSGSGKSSIMRAGVLAALRERGHRIVVLTPGRRPVEALTALPDHADARTVLAVDQTEEVFTLCEDPDVRRDFLDRLTLEATRRPVILTLRGDRLSQVTEHAGFSRLVERGLHLVGALDEEALRDAVLGPAQQAGLILEPGLVDLLVREVRDDPGALPLMSHALLETWGRREGNTLTVDGYHASGGIHGAVAQSAEQLYARVDTDQRPLLRDLVLRLVSPGVDGEAVRTQVPRRLIASDRHHEQLIEMLVGARLVTSDQGVLEITHEALARAWPRLRGWLDDDVEGQRTRHHLSGAADAWETLGRPDSELYRGVRLARALDWQSRTESALTDTEREFLSSSRTASDAEEQTAAERALQQARLIRRLRIVLGGATVLLVLALAAGGIAAVQSDRASESAAEAEQSTVSALARGAAARGSATGDLDTALLLAAAGVVLDESPETVGNLQQVISQNPALIRSTPLAGKETLALDVLPDGRTVALLDRAYSLSIVDLATGAELARQQIGTARSEPFGRSVLRASPDGGLIAVGAAPYSGRLLHLVDTKTLQPVAPQPSGLPRRAWRMIDAEFSRDGSTLVVVVNRLVRRSDSRIPVETRAYVWELGASTKPLMINLSRWTTEWASVALSPDGRLLYTASPAIRVHDLRSGGVRTLSVQRARQNEALGFDISPDGRQLVLAGVDAGTGVVLVDAESGRVRHALPHDTVTFDARFSSDGRRVLTVSGFGSSVAVWDSRSAARLAQFGTQAGDSPVDLAGRGTMLVSATLDQSLRRWDVDGKRRYLRRIPMNLPWRTGQEGACIATPSSGGQYVAYTLCQEGVGEESGLVLDVNQRAAHRERAAGTGYSFGGGSWFAPRAEYVRAEGGTLYVWDGRTGRVRAGSHPVGDRVTEVDHSTDGSRVVISELSGTLTLLDATDLEPVGRSLDLGDNVCCVALGPDNRTAFALVGGPERTFFWNDPADRWALVDLEAGSILHEGPLGLSNGTWAAYSPDGRHVAAGGFDGDIAIIDTSTGRLVRAPVRAHNGLVPFASFSPDGSQLVSGAEDGSTVLWDVETGTVSGRVLLDGSSWISPEFLPDGRILIVPWHRDPAVYAWDPSAERAVEFACQAVGRDLTEAEWAEHFPGQPYQSVCPQD